MAFLLRFVVGIVSVLGASSAMAQGSTFSTTIGTAVLCLDQVEPGFFYNYMSQTAKAYKQEQGAYWFKTSASLFGAPMTEVFVSDASGRHDFVGVVSSLPPDQLAEAVNQNAPAGIAFKKENPKDKFSIYSSPDGAVIAFQGRKGKIYCRRDRMRD